MSFIANHLLARDLMSFTIVEKFDGCASFDADVIRHEFKPLKEYDSAQRRGVFIGHTVICSSRIVVFVRDLFFLSLADSVGTGTVHIFTCHIS